MKAVTALGGRRWPQLVLLAVLGLGGCLNPRPDDLPSDRPPASATGKDGSSPGVAVFPPPTTDGNGSIPPGTPSIQEPVPATSAPGPAPADAGAVPDAGADAGPTDGDQGVQ